MAVGASAAAPKWFAGAAPVGPPCRLTAVGVPKRNLSAAQLRNIVPVFPGCHRFAPLSTTEPHPYQGTAGNLLMGRLTETLAPYAPPKRAQIST